MPYPGKRRADVTSEMLRQGYTPQRMVQTAEEFFTSLGLKAMPLEFWHRSMLERPVGRHVACKASAWDFCNRRDFRYVIILLVISSSAFIYLYIYIN